MKITGSGAMMLVRAVKKQVHYVIRFCTSIALPILYTYLVSLWLKVASVCAL